MKAPSSESGGLSLRQQLTRLAQICGPQGLSLEQLIQSLGARSHAFVVLILALPFIFPIPLPGLSTPFGVVIALLGIALALDRTPYLPKKIRHIPISQKLFSQIIEKSNWVLEKFGRLIHPRMRHWVVTPWGERFHGLFIFLSGVLLALPAPPGGNVGPALACILLALALLEEDGALTVLGVTVFSGSCFLMTKLIEGAWKLISSMF